MGNTDDIADQITGRNGEYSLGIPIANLKLQHMFRICSLILIACNDKLVNEIGLEIGFSEHYGLSFISY